jgi:hypothetical protein
MVKYFCQLGDGSSLLKLLVLVGTSAIYLMQSLVHRLKTAAMEILCRLVFRILQ